MPWYNERKAAGSAEIGGINYCPAQKGVWDGKN